MAKIFLIRRKTLSNQSINQLINLFYQNIHSNIILFKIFYLSAIIFIHLKYRTLKSQNLNEVRDFDYHILSESFT